jgi:hypothetical protein
MDVGWVLKESGSYHSFQRSRGVRGVLQEESVGMEQGWKWGGVKRCTEGGAEWMSEVQSEGGNYPGLGGQG